MSDSHETSPHGVAVRLRGVSVRYRVPTEPVSTLKEHVIRMLQGRRAEYREFWALDDIDLVVKQGEALGIIGRNGAGKSTLLKVVSRILRPTAGHVWVRGRVAPLIELGAGFHPELTGRENVFLNGAILGFSHADMQDRFESIVEFAELWDFIDAPLRTYSSGMMTRLGFAVASDVEPEILIIDEVLSVGDEAFQQKCLARMQSFRAKNTTILFVSHALDAIEKLCDRAIWIDQGQLRHSGAVGQTIQAYLLSL
jgi:lipopolysaccharide transport system ATP-binding protein